MNVQNLTKLRDTLVTLRDAGNAGRFAMNDWFSSGGSSLRHLPEGEAEADPRNPCGTAACLAGWCQLIGAETPADRGKAAVDFAQAWLGLDDDDTDRLFLGQWSPKVIENDFTIEGLEDITLDDAIAHLDSLLP